MAEFESVFDFMRSLPKHLNHEELYLEQVRERRSLGKNPVDLISWELAGMSTLEKNILSGLNMPEKFTLKNMHREFPLTVGSLIKGGSAKGAGTLKYKDKVKKSYLSDHAIYLPSCPARVHSSSLPGMVMMRDQGIRNRIMSSCANFSPLTLNGLSMTMVSEKLSFPSDMRHMLMKAYLYLMDYNLSHVSCVTEREEGVLLVNTIPMIDADMMLSAIVEFDVAVDSFNLTPSEATMLGMMGDAYPCVKYAGSNIYNSLSMDADNLVIYSANEIEMLEGYDFGSPDDMYNVIVNLACKLDCLDEMRIVFKELRGLPGMLHRVCAATNRDCLTLRYPTSLNYKLALGEANSWCDYIDRPSNYYSTTKCLIADILISDAIECVAFNEMSKIGAFGVIGCPTNDSDSDPVLQSNMRDHGYKHDNPKVNEMLIEMSVVREATLIVSVQGVVKEWLSKRRDMCLNGYYDWCPQLNFEIPTMAFGDTPFSVTRGMKIEMGLTKSPDEAVGDSSRLNCLMWCIGMTRRLPKVGMNAIGQHDVDLFTMQEHEEFMFADGEYRLANVTYTIGCDVVGRRDRLEVTAMSLHRTQYRGTRTLAIIDYQGRTKILSTTNVLDFDSGGTLGIRVLNSNGDTVPREELEILTPGGAPLKNVSEKRPKPRPVKVGGRKPLVHINTELPRMLKEMGTTTTFDYAIEGGEAVVDHILPPVTDVGVAIGALKYYKIPTSGSGLLCGYRACAQDLVIHGFLEPANASDFMDNLVKESGMEDNVYMEVLARTINDLGMGLTVLVRNSGIPGWSEMSYGTGGNIHNVRLQLDGNHYSNILVDPNGPSEVEITNLSPITDTAVASARHAQFANFIALRG